MSVIVSVIVPCYNQGEYLDECLQSVLDQSYTNWECIIVNDGSLDDTEEITQKWINKDSRFNYLSKENGGLSNARNSGISKAIGEFILPLDADDKINIDYLKLALQAFQEDDSLTLVYCRAEKFGDSAGEWKLPDFSLENLAKNNMIFCTALFRKIQWELVEGYDEKMKYGWEDWEFWIAILKKDGKVRRIDYVGFYYRVKESSMLKDLKMQEKEFLLKYMSFKHADFYIAQFGSFKKLNDNFDFLKQECEKKINSKKFVIDLFCSRFFGFSIFGKYKKNH